MFVCGLRVVPGSGLTSVQTSESLKFQVIADLDWELRRTVRALIRFGALEVYMQNRYTSLSSNKQ